MSVFAFLAGDGLRFNPWPASSYSRIKESGVRSKNCSSSDLEVEAVYFINLLACCIRVRVALVGIEAQREGTTGMV
jgi:hypothetical protein